MKECVKKTNNKHNQPPTSTWTTDVRLIASIVRLCSLKDRVLLGYEMDKWIPGIA